CRFAPATNHPASDGLSRARNGKPGTLLHPLTAGCLLIKKVIPMLLGPMLHQTRARTPDKVALWFGDRKWTYAELDDATDRIAAALSAAGVRVGDRVALFLLNCPELVLAYFACFKLGAITVPVNYRYRQPEVQYALEHSGATTLIVHPNLLGEVQGLP